MSKDTQVASKKEVVSDRVFSIGDKVVYPAHGVGEITALETQIISGYELKVYVICFDQDRMTIRVPIAKAASSGLRELMDRKDVQRVYTILKGSPKVGNRMWSRRAQEYEMKINSGDLIAVAEVVRDLYRASEADRSYSERAIYELALNRLASEVSVLEKMSKEAATAKLIEVLKDKVTA